MTGQPCSDPSGRRGARRLFWLVLSLAAVAAGAPAPAAQGPAASPHPHGSWKGDCSLCHREDQWAPAIVSKAFDHGKYYPLEGAHKTVACRHCHASLEFARAGRACVDCHQDVHRGEFGVDCARCHTPRSFIDPGNAVRLHRTTLFPLTGAHASADCDACHRPAAQGHMSFVGLRTDCAGCHNSTSFPAATQRPADHATGGFSLDCSLCHSTVSFSLVKFNHAASGFPLSGVHATLQCVACHGTPFNAHLDPACFACHQPDYTGATAPPHATLNFDHDCRRCHSSFGSWAGAVYVHTSTFPLSGVHGTLACVDCHGTPFNPNLDPACFTCHSGDYNGTTDPKHTAALLDHDCRLCHSSFASWAGATYNHNHPLFSLTGAHVGLDCNRCHADNVYAGRPTDCFSCHQPDYNGTNDPYHGAAGFDHNCALCHTTTSWAGARYAAHDAADFPIYTGNHASRWTHCSDCHTSTTDYGVYSCMVVCHSNADSRHQGNTQYGHDCIRCHPTGTAGGRRLR